VLNVGDVEVFNGSQTKLLPSQWVDQYLCQIRSIGGGKWIRGIVSTAL